MNRMTSIWPATLELLLDGMAQGGEAVGRWDERVVFASGGLPGERVRVQLSERHDAYARGTVTAVLEAAPERIVPRLPGADHIPWQHIDYAAQLRFKRQIVADQLAKIGGLPDAPVADTLAAPHPWGYRNSARLHGANGELGYFAAASRELQPIAHDPLLLPVLNEALADLRMVLRDDSPDEIILRTSETYGYVLAALRTAHGSGADPLLLARRWRTRCAALAGITVLVPGQAEQVLGAAHLIEELGGIAFQLRPTSFFQVNRAAAELLLTLVRAGLKLSGTERLLDLYCGAGAFMLPLAAQVREVVGIEEFPNAVEDGRASAALNEVTNAQFLAGRVEAVLPKVEAPAEAVVLDPPRRGCHPQAIAQLLRLAPARIVYVSCQPGTLARDLKLLVAGGYSVASVQPVDLFPQTAHIESVTVLMREA